MARYAILARKMVLPQLAPIGSAETPAEAVSKARAFIQEGRQGVEIQDNQGERLAAEAFAAKHGIR